MWTLMYEFGCYLAIGVLGFLGRRSRLTFTLWGSLVLTTFLGLQESIHPGGLPSIVAYSARLGGFFIAGALLRMHSRRVPSDVRLFVLSLGALVLVAGLGEFRTLGPLPCAYAFTWLAVNLPASMHSIGRRNDFSYGVYLYGFPVQQVLAATFLTGTGPWAFALASTAATMPFAVMSWFMVERSALARKSSVPRILPGRLLAPGRLYPRKVRR
jgi:peptidoglycan/LPS O-acetylase OafA/YrhL